MPDSNEEIRRELIIRNEGITEAERYLKRLCDRTFLSLWSYPGIFRDQGINQRAEGKEVCDLLVVFDKHIIIFSDKDCKFPDSGTLWLDWNRWFKKGVLKSAKQAWGAERWIKEHPDRLYLDAACSQEFPFDLPSPDEAIFHLVVVAHDSAERCRKELGGSGSLMIRSSLIGSDHFVDNKGNGIPFTIGDIDASRTFVHVLDDLSLDIVLNTVDTVTDFVSYLQRKERFLRSNVTVFASGEEDLLAFYLKYINEEGEHDFVVSPDINSLVLEEGHWEHFQQRPERRAQLKADEISYAWDSLIERFNSHTLNGTQYWTSHDGVEYSEKILRFMARESRFRRRMLARGIADLMLNTPDGTDRTRYFYPHKAGLPYYVFIAFPKPKNVSDEKYREIRRGLLEAKCMVLKVKFPDAMDIVGIASEPIRKGKGSSEDVMYLDASQWSKEMQEEAEHLQEEFGIMKKVKMHNIHEREYPDIGKSQSSSRPVKARNLRNKPCPCGSGKKYKHCHGSR